MSVVSRAVACGQRVLPRGSACQAVKKVVKSDLFGIVKSGKEDMLRKEAEQRQAIEMLYTDILVPREHLLRKIVAAM